jgi:hypothetical protein
MITRLKRIKNVSKGEIELHHADGCRTTLPPNAVKENVAITNAEELFTVAEITRDLAEIQGDYSHVHRIRKRLDS